MAGLQHRIEQLDSQRLPARIGRPKLCFDDARPLIGRRMGTREENMKHADDQILDRMHSRFQRFRIEEVQESREAALNSSAS